MFLSLRAALERWPRQLRFFVLMLALLTWVAPTWHICELGGHVMSCSSGMASHHGDFLKAVDSRASDGSTVRGALICYCAPHESKAPGETYHGPLLTSAPASGSHATCLALLLQGMPAVVTHAEVPAEVFVSRPVQFETRSFSYTPRNVRFARGRAPPVRL